MRRDTLALFEIYQPSVAWSTDAGHVAASGPEEAWDIEGHYLHLGVVEACHNCTAPSDLAAA